jgi:hypothetical protein
VGSHNSGLLDQDVSDILCILHPGSHPAHEAVDATSRQPKGYQHILQRDEFQFDSIDSSSRDIAIRMTSSVHDLSLGFVFGRNPAKCDVLLSPEVASKHISNIHFRIFVNEDGILMLQDLSTNGTVVDDTRLWKRNGQATRMLVNGSVIIVASDNKHNKEVRFVVRIPSRDGFHVQYTQNLMAYLDRVSRHNAKVQNLQARAPPPQKALQWTLGSAYGMHWTGGSMYNVTGQIGKGAFATVYKLATKQDGIVYAAKELDKRRFMKNGILDQKVDNEMKIMKDLRHVRTLAFDTRPLTNSFASPILSNMLIIMNMTAGFILSWSTLLGASCPPIWQPMESSPKTWSKASPGSFYTLCNICISAKSLIETSSRIIFSYHPLTLSE